MADNPVLLDKLYKNHTVPNAVEDLRIEALPDNAYDVHTQPIRNLQITIQFLGEDSEEVIDTIVGKARSGSVKAESNSLIRRTANLSLNVDENLFPKAGSLIWFDKKIKIYAGLLDLQKGEYVNFLLGHFWVEKGSYREDVSGSVIDLTLSDKMGQYADTPLENPFKLEINTPIHVAIKKFMEHLGETKFGYIQESNEGEVVPYTLEFDIAEKASDVLEKLRDMYMDYYCGYNVNGEFEFRRISVQKEDEVADPKWIFNHIENQRHDLKVSFSEDYDLKGVKNRIIVKGGTSEKTGLTYSGEVRVTDPKSPFNVYAIGERTEVIKEDSYMTMEQCLARGRYETYKLSTFKETATIETLPLYLIDTHDVIENYHKDLQITSRYMIDSFDYDLSPSGKMNISASKIYHVSLEYGEERVPLVDAIIRGISNWGWLSLGEERIKACFNIMGSASASLVVRFNDIEGGGTQASITSYPTTKNQTLLIDLADFSELDFNNENGAVAGRSKGDYLDRVLGHEMFHAVTNDYYGHENAVQFPIWWKEGFAELLHGGYERFQATMDTYKSKGITGTAFREALIENVEAVLKNEWRSTSDDYVAAYLAAVAIYRLCSESQWRNLFIKLRDVSNPGINFLSKFLPIADTETKVRDAVISEVRSMSSIWTALEDKNQIDTVSIGGKHLMNLFGASLTSETVFNNSDASEVSIGFQIKFEK